MMKAEGEKLVEFDKQIEQLRTELAAEKALRIAAEQQYDEQFKAHGYWYRRAMEDEQVMRDALADMNSDLRSGGETKARETLTEGLNREDRDERSPFEQRQRDKRQAHILAWAVRTFTMPGCEPASLGERARRFLEEALELFQAVYGTGGEAAAVHCRQAARSIAVRVFERPAGEVRLELGQVAVTLACLAESLGLSVAAEEANEFERVLSIPTSEFRARHQAKIDSGL